ncbi:hypothetical protein PspLS_04663 [Pyricularia sp. CBS 133598]|nr:hypothetical protein PspLS_04663 [Pyricularia sp. CBS 133598]
MASSITPGPDDGLDLQSTTVSSQTSSSSTTQPPIQDDYPMKRLLELCQETSVDKLENGLKLGIKLLQELKPAVRDLNSPTGNNHLKAIDGLLQADKRDRAVVGVVGSTGAGKSSVLNAVLNESQLLPTSCMRACTASVTELSFNHLNDPEQKYRAEVEFISKEDWITELELLWDDIIDSSGKIRPEAKAKNGDASIAFDKVKAVYPAFGKSASSVYDFEELAKEPMVQEVLGTNKKFQAETAADLVLHLQPYIDSKERSGDTDAMEAWPLVKVVRIYIKADALANGLVLVDIPGVHDSNAARAAVADKYIKDCSGMWILAPIQRAVDDKSAKTLMGTAFKEQLQFDGMFGKVTFICSKTDIMPVSEAIKSLKLEEKVQKHWKLIAKIQDKKRLAKKENEKLVLKRGSLQDDRDQRSSELSIWKQLSKDFSRGLPVFPPPPEVLSRKRKHRTRQTRDRKDLSSGDSEDSLSSEDELEDDEPTGSNPVTTLPLTRLEIDQNIVSLKESLEQLDSQLAEAKEDVYQSSSTLRLKLRAFKKEEAKQHHAIVAMCIKGRNDYSRKAIQQDFAMGIKELDEAALIDEDESSFNPDVDFRDYDKVADSLPVFCVSSPAYQHLCGRNERDRFKSEGFGCVEDTEIPQLVKHAQGMTEASRVGHCRRFLNGLLQLVESMLIWTRPRDANMQLTDEERDLINDVLRRELEAFEIALATAIDLCVTTMQDYFSNLIISTFDSKIPAATSIAVDVCRAWSAPQKEGGMHWKTYQATLKRKGCYHGASGQRNFNRELLEPIMAPVALAWEETFQRRVPKTIKKLVTSVQTALRALHAQFANANNLPVPTQDLATLRLQVDRYLATAAGIPAVLQKEIIDVQRQANRQIEPVIVINMTPGYDKATKEHGAGLYMRMKDVMAGHVEAVRNTMFEKAKQTVQDRLAAMTDKVQEVLKKLVSLIFTGILQDYKGVLLNNNDEDLIHNNAQLRNHAKHLSKIAEILAAVDKRFTLAYEAAPATEMAKEEMASFDESPVVQGMTLKTEQ